MIFKFNKTVPRKYSRQLRRRRRRRKRRRSEITPRDRKQCTQLTGDLSDYNTCEMK